MEEKAIKILLVLTPKTALPTACVYDAAQQGQAVGHLHAHLIEMWKVFAPWIHRTQQSTSCCQQRRQHLRDLGPFLCLVRDLCLYP